MTVLSSENKKEYECNGTIDEFVVDFQFIKKSDLKVFHIDSANIFTLLTLDSDYSVNEVDYDFSNGGKIKTSTIYPTGEKIYIERNLSETQEVDLLNGGTLKAEVLESAFDKAMMLIIDTALKFISVEFTPDERAGKYLKYDDNGVLEIVDEVSIDALTIPASPNGKLFGFDSSGNPIAVDNTMGKFVKDFTVSDWTSNFIQVTLSEHKRGLNPIVQVFELNGDYREVGIETLIQASGDVMIVVDDVADNFIGRIIIK